VGLAGAPLLLAAPCPVCGRRSTSLTFPRLHIARERRGVGRWLWANGVPRQWPHKVHYMFLTANQTTPALNNHHTRMTTHDHARHTELPMYQLRRESASQWRASPPASTLSSRSLVRKWRICRCNSGSCLSLRTHNACPTNFCVYPPTTESGNVYSWGGSGARLGHGEDLGIMLQPQKVSLASTWCARSPIGGKAFRSAVLLLGPNPPLYRS